MARHNIRLVILIVLASLFLGIQRIVPHPPNFTPVVATAVFLPWLLGWNPLAVLPALGAMVVGDLYWGFHPYMLYTYGSIILIGIVSLKIHNIWLAAIAGSVVFFVVTNFGVWLSGYYGYTLAGLLECYVMAIPFYTNTVISTIFYTVVFVFITRIVAHFTPLRQTP